MVQWSRLVVQFHPRNRGSIPRGGWFFFRQSEKSMATPHPTVADLWLDDDCESWANPLEILDGADNIRETSLDKMMGGPQTGFVLLLDRAWCDLFGAIARGYPALTRIIIDCNYVHMGDFTRVVSLNALPKTLQYIEFRAIQSDVDCRHLLEFPDLEICVLNVPIIYHKEALAQIPKLRWLVVYEDKSKIEGLEQVHPANLDEYRALRKTLNRVAWRSRGEPYYFAKIV